MAAAKKAKVSHDATLAPLSKQQKVLKPQLDTETGWEELETGPSPDELVAGEEETAKVKLSKHQKLQRRKAEETAIREAELRRLQGDAAPTSAAEYEALLLSSADSSFVWIKYMAFLISLGDIEQARAVAQRAFSAINYREDAEKFNVWVALLNLENTYGDETTTLSTLGRALQHTDARRMYLAATDIFQRSERTSLLEQCCKAMSRKFSASTEIWLRIVRLRLDQGDEEAASATLARSLQSLPKSEHVHMISHTALLEFKHGDAERGRSIFEGILRNYPKRLDLWSVALFERATHLHLPAKKMKFLFKRWLDFEKAQGNAEGVEHVKKSAMAFVESVGQS
ncbi:RRP5-like protein [Auxenochlorella protothecoides]|uniref:RRP5-like protein n=2 Tax=Auxenochlorella protothecoides TaxID=3075 RepID=A0A087SG72_AUXPR|nr:RRP5-like protein [Auxenochlorella protothecoides]KFM24726.1 RRP5-like protein [Auxenochlorella protothecoides]